jgi:fructoselysine 6-kinase
LRILGLGDNTVDTYVDLGLQFPGGNAVNVAVLAARLGAQSAYFGNLGQDEAGDLIFSALVAEGVDVSRVHRADGPNARALIGHAGGDRRFLSSTRGVRGDYAWTDADFEWLGEFDAVHTSIYSELDPLLPRLSASTHLLSYDHSERWTQESLARTLPHLAVAFLSAPGRSDAECEALLRACEAQGCETVVVTRGPAGAMAIHDGALTRQGIVPAEMIDTLGAGDGFIAAFLVARLGGAGMADAMARGADCAARVCGWQGAFGRGAAWAPAKAGAYGEAG